MQRKISFFIGFVLLLAVIVNIVLWIAITASGTNSFEDSVKEYMSFYPSFLAEPVRLTIINILLLLISIACFIRSSKGSTSSFFKTLCNVLIVLSSILAFWNLFSLM